MGTNNGNGYAHKHLLFSAISPETAKNLLDEFLYLESPDLTQIAYCLRDYTTPELKTLKARLMLINDQLQEVIYKRTPRGKASNIKRYAKDREKRANARKEKLESLVDSSLK